MSHFIETVAEFIFHIVIEIFLVSSGEIVRWLVSGGRHRPRWDLYTSEQPAKFIVFSEVSFWIGLLSWVALIAVFFYLRAAMFSGAA